MAKIERVIYYQLMNSFPKEKRYLFSFILGILDHMDKIEGKEKVLLNHIRVLLFSEVLIPRVSRNTEYSNLKHYNKFN